MANIGPAVRDVPLDVYLFTSAIDPVFGDLEDIQVCGIHLMNVLDVKDNYLSLGSIVIKTGLADIVLKPFAFYCLFCDLRTFILIRTLLSSRLGSSLVHLPFMKEIIQIVHCNPILLAI